jgi:cytochrome P450
MLWLLVRLARNPATMYRDVRERYGATVWLHGFRRNRWLFISRPQDIRRVHQGNHRAYGRGSLNTPFTEFLGDGLLTSERDTWSRHRRLMNPYFFGAGKETFVAAASGEVGTLLDSWAAHSDGAPFDICPSLELFTYRVVAHSMFGLTEGDDAATVRALDSALTYVSRESFRMIGPPARFPSLARRRFRRDMRTLHDLLTPAIAATRARGEQQAANLLDELVSSGHALTDAEIRDEVLTMLHAGQHTVASGLAFALYLIGSHPEVENTLLEELRTLRGPVPDFDELSRLPYLDAVIDETLRLYPPAWGGVRESLEPDQLGGIAIESGTPVVFSQFVTHRSGSYWADPEAFVPTRPDRASGRGDYRYFPFGGGPHLCIGRDVALLEMKLALAAILARFTLRPVPGHKVRPLAQLDLIPAGGIPMRLTPREGAG